MVKKTEDIEKTEEKAPESLVGAATPMVAVTANVTTRGLTPGQQANLPDTPELQLDIENGYLSRSDG